MRLNNRFPTFLYQLIVHRVKGDVEQKKNGSSRNLQHLFLRERLFGGVLKRDIKQNVGARSAPRFFQKQDVERNFQDMKKTGKRGGDLINVSHAPFPSYFWGRNHNKRHIVKNFRGGLGAERTSGKLTFRERVQKFIASRIQLKNNRARGAHNINTSA